MRRSILLHTLLIFIHFLLFHSACAQVYSFTHYQVDEGLSNNSVTCSLMDHKGFLWFGTKDGLNRYDGLNFKAYLHNVADKNSLGNDFINCLAQDRAGNLLVGTDRGLYIFDYGTENFIKVTQGSDRPIRAVISDKFNNIWYIAGSELYQRTTTGPTRSFGDKIYASALCLEGENLWVGAPQGILQKFDYTKGIFKRYADNALGKKIPDYWVEKLYCDQPGKIYIGTSNYGARMLDTKSGRYSDIVLRDHAKKGLFVRDFIHRTKSEIWMATESGIFVYDEDTGRNFQMVNRLDDPYSLSDNAVYTFLKDRQGGVWAGTYYGGINYSAALNTPFEKYTPSAKGNSISGRTVREICRDKAGNLWIGTEDAGLNMLNTATGKFTAFSTADRASGIRNPNIHGLLVDDDKLWIGTFEQGLDIMDLSTNRIIKRYRAGFGPRDLKSNFIYCLYRTRDKKILIGTPEGLYFYDNHTDDFNLFTSVPIHAFYTNLLEDSHGKLWAGTFRDGVFIMPSARVPGKNPGGISRVSGLETERITSIIETRDHKMFITTESGLYRCNQTGKIEKHYNTEDGLPTDMLYSLLEDERGQLWISSSKGLIVYNRSNQTFVVFSKANGLLTDQFNYNSAYKDVNGKMYFGSVKGLIALEPKKFKKDTIIPPVYITGFQVRNEELTPGPGSPLKKSIILTDNIKLPYHNATFSIDFSALRYPSPGEVIFEYRLAGLEPQWTVLRKNRRVYFTEVPPGQYTFMVRALNQDHTWNTKPTKLSIEIVPPFWKHQIAYLTYAILLAFIVYFIISRYKRRLQNEHKRQMEIFENKKQHEIYEAKIEFFTNIAHEIRTPLTLIRVPMDKLIKRSSELPELTKSIKTMERNTNRLLALTNQLLDFRSTEKEAFSLNFVKANIHDLLTDIWMDFQAAAEEQNINYTINLPEEKLLAFVDVEAFTKIISNLLDNGIKFADKVVFLQLVLPSNEGQQFCVKIGSDSNPLSSDLREQIFKAFFTGNHHAVNKKGTGLGLALARALTELHNGTLILEERSGSCNVFSLALPLHQQFEFDLNGKWRKK